MHSFVTSLAKVFLWEGKATQGSFLQGAKDNISFRGAQGAAPEGGPGF